MFYFNMLILLLIYNRWFLLNLMVMIRNKLLMFIKIIVIRKWLASYIFISLENNLSNLWTSIGHRSKWETIDRCWVNKLLIKNITIFLKLFHDLDSLAVINFMYIFNFIVIHMCNIIFDGSLIYFYLFSLLVFYG
jgi:hypothetical protein